MDLHNDPFNTARIRKEADDDRAAGEARITAQEEAHKRTTRQRLDNDRRRLTQERDDKKKKLDDLRREAEKKKREQKAAEINVRTEHSAEKLEGTKPPDMRERHLLEAHLARVKASLAEITTPVEHINLSADVAAEHTLNRNLDTAKAGLEKATLEHNLLTDEIRQLKRLLEQKETLAHRVGKEKEEASALVTKLEKEKETTALDQEMKNRAHRIHHDAGLKAAREKEALEREQLEIQTKLAALDQKERELSREKQGHMEAARKAETEKVRLGNTVHDLEHSIDQLTRELSLIEASLHEVESKLSKL